MQVKADISFRQSESSECPYLCEGCLGENPYIRMQKIPFGGKCKMCDRPFTLFKWRPGRGEGYKKTEVCQTCSRLKNICQTCILDLQYGLPSQLRDAVLAEIGDTAAIPESDVGKEYQAQKQLLMLENGENPWQNQSNPNELLIDVARSAINDRSQSRVKLPSNPQKRSHKDAFEAEEVAEAERRATEKEKSLILASNEDFSLPPGLSDAAQITSLGQKLPAFLKPTLSEDASTGSSNGPSHMEPSKKLPPKPPGPPPAWAFRNQASTVNSTTSVDSSTVVSN